MNDLIIPGGDGWNDAAKESGGRTIRGRILRFADWRWTCGKEQAPVPPGTRLIALETVAAWVRWENNRPVEQRVRPPGGRLQDREELGFDDERLWEFGPGGTPTDPWRDTRYVYLVSPSDAAAFTFSTSSFGGRRAVADLGDQIARMRTVHADATPLVELSAAEMPTQYGRKSKPVFKIVAWRTAAGAEPVERQLTIEDAQQAVRDQEMDDEIPF